MFRTARWFQGVLGFAVAAAALTAGTAQAQVTLRWKFKPGQTLSYEMRQDMSQKGEIAGNPVNLTMNMTMNMTWKVKAVDANGTADVTQTLDRIRMKMEMPGGMPGIDYDSASEEEPEGLARQMAPMFKAMIKKPFSMKISPRGKISDMKFPEGLRDQLGKMPGGKDLGDMLSPEGMQQLGGIVAMPEDPVEPGKTWTEKATIKNPVAGKQSVETTFRYVGKVQEEGKSLEKIAMDLDIKLGAGAKNLPVEIKKQESKGTLLFDNAAGHTVATNLKMKMTMELSVAGQKAEQDVDMDVQMKLVPPPSKE